MIGAKKLIIPKSCLIPAVSVGVIISIIAFTFVGSGFIPSFVMMVPKYLTSSDIAFVGSLKDLGQNCIMLLNAFSCYYLNAWNS